MGKVEREDREFRLQNRFGPIVGVSELSDADFAALEKSAEDHDAAKRAALSEEQG